MFELVIVLSWMMLLTHAGLEPQAGSAHSQITPVETDEPVRIRWKVDAVVKCSRYTPVGVPSTSMSSCNELWLAVPVQSPIQAQFRSSRRRAVPVLPSQTQASAVPLDDRGTANDTFATSMSSSRTGVARFMPWT